jgi:hypothetical protein
MAKAENPLGITGKIQGMVISKTKFGYVVRSAGGWISKSKIKNNPRYIKIKQINEDFGLASRTGKRLRQAVLATFCRTKDYRISARMTQYMFKVLEQDKINPKGKRTIAEGLKSPEGKAVMKTFNFNIDSLLENILLSSWIIDKATLEISIPDMVPAKSLSAPRGATHFSISGAVLQADFQNNRYKMTPTNIVNSGIVQKLVPVTLTPAAKPEASGFSIILLKIEFFKMANNVQTPFKDGVHNSIAVIEVI